MKTFLLLACFINLSFHNGKKESFVSTNKIKPTILVLPPYDVIAGRGISPDIQQYIENELAKDSSVTLRKFPYKKMMNVPYQNVFDKQFCKPILAKIKSDVIIMSYLELLNETGSMSNDTWNLRLKVYNTTSGKQTSSKIVCNGLTAAKIKEQLVTEYSVLRKELQ